MNTTFCETVSDCGQVCDPDETVCIVDQVVRLQLPQGWAAALYVVFRLVERYVFAVYTQASRELLKISPSQRMDFSTCCGDNRCPTGVYKQMWLRFFGSFFGVLSFFLILEQNVIMFAAVVLIDVVFEYYFLRKRPKDHDLAEDDFHHAGLAWFLNEQHYEKLDIDEEWLDNFKKLMAKYRADESRKPKELLPLKYF